MSQQIIAFSGKKQSGKNTACNFLFCLKMVKNAICSQAKILDNGKIWVKDLFGDKAHRGIFDLENNSDLMREFKAVYLDDFVKMFSFADALKQDVCINLLGLTYEQCYGTDKDKNSLTNIMWEDVPGVVSEGTEKELEIVRGRMGDYYGIDSAGLIYHKPGPMTAREVLQYVGTGIFRRLNNNVWAESCLRKIKGHGCETALISDTRFPNEVEEIQSAGGVVIRLLRNSDSEDTHPSETALDDYPLENYDAVIDNTTMSIDEQNEAVYSTLHELGMSDEEIV